MIETGCSACRDGRHGGCVGTIECVCYAYGEAHANPVRVLEHVGRSAYSDLDEHDFEKDLGDGGLGSGRWLER